MAWHLESVLYAFAALPVLLLALWASRRFAKKRREAFANERVLQTLRQGFSPRVSAWRTALILAAITLLTVGLAGPKLGTEVREIEQKGVDMMIALDLSRSMNAEDIRPTRLDKAKFEILKLIEQLEGNRIGLIVFTGEAFLQSPLTLDHSALRMFLDIASTQQMPTSTTDVDAAFRMAQQAFSEQSGPDASSGQRTARQEASRGDQASKVLLLISDGETHDQSFDNSLESLTQSGVRVYSVGVGTQQGAPIPVFDESSGQVQGYYRDEQGAMVSTKLERSVLQQIAQQSQGEYYEIGSSSSNLLRFSGELDKLQQGTFSAQEFIDFKHQYQWFVGIGLLLFLVAWAMPDSFKRSSTTAAASSMALILLSGCQPIETSAQLDPYVMDSLIHSRVIDQPDVELLVDNTRQMRLQSSKAIMWTERGESKEDYTDMKGGVFIEAFDSAGAVTATATARRARYVPEELRLTLFDSVIVTSGNSGDSADLRTLYAQELYWNADSNFISSTQAVTILTPTDSITGTEFRSSTDLTRYTILSPRGRSEVD
ncbi:MAG: LPS export ABC transporter periplasmic protein LptC [Balneolaceae bacterium]|nr:LPS export ABC transporter periplasmic protein LptC [Balneolaceae bacterium]